LADFPRLVTPPAAEPVSLVEAKRQVRQDLYDDDHSLAGYISAARVLLEKQYGMAFVAQTWHATQDRFPRGWGCFGWPFAGDVYSGWSRGIPRRRDSTDGYLDRVTLRVGKPPFLLLNALNYLDMSGTPQLIETIIPAGVSATGSQTVTPYNMAGIYAGTQYGVIDGAASEIITVAAVTGMTFAATFASTHGPNAILSVLVPNSPAGTRFISLDGRYGIARIAPVFGQIWPLVIHQLGSVKLAWTAGYGPVTQATSAIAAGTQTVMPVSMAGIYPGSVFWADPGKGNAEQIVVLSTTATTFAATFANPHAQPVEFNGVPQTIRQAILMLVGHWFINRESVGSVGKAVEDGVEALMASERFAEYE
jgi:hypothetical protein